MKRVLFACALALGVLWALYLWPIVALVGAVWLFSLLAVGVVAWCHGMYWSVKHAVESAEATVEVATRGADAARHLERAERVARL